MQKVFFIHAEWDEEAGVWVATSDDVPGLATEADTLEALSTKLEARVPELLDANGWPESQEVYFELLARRRMEAMPSSIFLRADKLAECTEIRGGLKPRTATASSIHKITS